LRRFSGSPLGELVAQEAEIDAEQAQLVLEVFIGFASIQRQQNARGGGLVPPSKD
jgi:hypothetical protein